MLHVALDGLDQVGDQVVPPLQLHVDLGEGVLVPVPGDDQPVVDAHDPERERHPDAQEHEQSDDDGTSLALTSGERTVGLLHRTTAGARLILRNPAEKLRISRGRSSKDGYHILSRGRTNSVCQRLDRFPRKTRVRA